MSLETHRTDWGNLHEFLHDIKKRSKSGIIVDQIPAMPFSRADTELSSFLEIEAEKNGTPVPRINAMMAAVAINHQCKFNTPDKYFRIFKGHNLKIIKLPSE